MGDDASCIPLFGLNLGAAFSNAKNAGVPLIFYADSSYTDEYWEDEGGKDRKSEPWQVTFLDSFWR
jgi:hypothetical protein